jgi:hypothetical protein
MSSSYYLRNLIESKAYLVEDPENQYILLEGRCHPGFTERPFSERGAKLCVKNEGYEAFPGPQNFPVTSSQAPRSSPKHIPRRLLWASDPNFEIRVDSPGMSYGPDPDPQDGYSQVSVWQGPLRRVPNQRYLVDNGYLKQNITYDGYGFGSMQRQDKRDYLSNFDIPASWRPTNEPRVPRKYNVTNLVQKYPLWKKATRSPDHADQLHDRKIV